MTSEFWELRRIDSLGRIITGKTPSSKNPEYFDGPFPFITIPDLEHKLFMDETERSISNAGAEKLNNSVIPKNSVCVSCIATIGRVGLTTKPSITNQQINSIVCNDDVDPIFLYYAMCHFSHDLKFFTGGGAVVANISKSLFGKMEIFLPPFLEQKSIGEKLLLLDKLIRKNKKKSEVHSKLIETLFRSWFIDFDPVKAKAESKLPFGLDVKIAALFPDSFEESELGPIPSGWEIVSLADCIQANARVGWKGLSVDEYVDSGPYIVTGPQLISGNVDWQKCGHVPLFRYEESPDIMLQENDVLLTKDGTIGKVALVHSMPGKATIAAGLFRLRARREVCGHGFVLCLLNSYLFDSLIWTRVEGAVIPHLYQVHLRAFKFAIPGPELMLEFEKMVNPLIESMKKSAQTIIHLERIRDTLLKRLMSNE